MGKNFAWHLIAFLAIFYFFGASSSSFAKSAPKPLLPPPPLIRATPVPPPPQPLPPPEEAVSTAAADGGVASASATVESASTPEKEDSPAVAAPSDAVNPDQLAGEAEALVSSGNPDEAVAKIQEASDALASSTRLTEVYLQACLAQKIPAWMEVKKHAERIISQSSRHPIANLALGRYWSEGTKKTDLTKALQYLSVAKSPKRNPPAGAAMLYYKVLAKQNWAILVGIAGILAIAGWKLRERRRKAAAFSPGIPGQVGDMVIVPEGGVPSEGSENSIAAIEPTASLSPESPVAQKQALVDVSEAQPSLPEVKLEATPFVKPVQPALSSPPQPVAPVTAFSAQPFSVSSPQPAAPTTAFSAQPVSVPSPQPVAPATAFSAQPVSVSSPQLVTPVVDLTAAGRASRLPELPPTVLPGAVELESRWEHLRQLASSRPIPLNIRQQKSSHETLATDFVASDKVPNDTVLTRPDPHYKPIPGAAEMFAGLDAGRSVVSADSAKSGKSSDESFSRSSDVQLVRDLSIDLSDEGLKDDLLGKLKMLAIEDGELRALLSQRNIEHVPHLIEYVLTRPEPVRLAYVAREIGHYRDPAVADVLASLLYHDDQRVVLAAIQGLQNNGGMAAVLHLCPFLQSPVAVLVDAAKNALGAFGPQKILIAFTELPTHPDERVREGGIFVLSRMRGRPVVELLQKMLASDRSENVRKKIMLAMTFHKDPSYINVLRDFMKSAGEDEKKLARKAIVYLQGFVPRQQVPGTASRA
ncbi:MAG: HEAT repeat domain-containing protein [Candidatus Riflebacteria bacterium]|nr:HEAT repeat domain-containing protein [Candidatus Riflebacteria bacterium]